MPEKMGTGIAVGVTSKKEKYPKEGKEDGERKQKERAHPQRVSVVVFAGLFLLHAVPTPFRRGWGRSERTKRR